MKQLEWYYNSTMKATEIDFNQRKAALIDERTERNHGMNINWMKVMSRKANDEMKLMEWKWVSETAALK